MVRKFPVCRLVTPAELQHDATDRVGRMPTIVMKLAEGVVTVPPLVLAKRLKQVVEWLGTQIEAFDRVGQGDQDSAGRVASEGVVQLPLQRVELLSNLRGRGQRRPCWVPGASSGARAARVVLGGWARLCGLIGQVVGGAANGVDVEKMLPHRPGNQDTGDQKILVVRSGDLPTNPLRGGQIGGGGGRGKMVRRSAHSAVILNVVSSRMVHGM